MVGSTPTRFRQSPVESTDLTPQTTYFRTILALVLAPSWPQATDYERKSRGAEQVGFCR